MNYIFPTETKDCGLEAAVFYCTGGQYMENFLELAGKRESCRKFNGKPVAREDLLKCVEAARLAPSACNSQPWKFIIVDDSALKIELCRAAFSAPYTASWPEKAGAILVVISERGNFTARVGNFVRDTRYYLVDIGIAVEHFILQAAELGLGTCWMGWFNEKGVKKTLGLPASSKVDIIVPVGYAETNETRKKVRRRIEETYKFNK